MLFTALSHPVVMVTLLGRCALHHVATIVWL